MTELQSDVKWKRLPALALLFFLMSSIRLAVKQGYQALPAILPMFIFLERFRDLVPWFALAIGVITVIATVLRYLRFFYAVERGEDGKRVRVRQGVFNHTDLSLGFERIQQADVYQPFYLRPFALAVLKLQSAGSKAQEVEIAGLSLDWSKQLQQEILQKSTQAGSNPGVQGDDSADPDVTGRADFELTLPPTEVLRIGLTQNVLIVFALIAGVVFSNQQLNDHIQDRLEAYIAEFDRIADAVLMISLWGLGVILLLIVGTVLVYFNQYYNYHLTRYGDKYQYKAGLLSSLSRSFRMHKLQHIQVKQGIVGRLLRRHAMRISQAGGFAAMKERFTVPVLDQTRLTACLSDLNLPKPRWQSVHPILATRYIIIPALVALVFLPLWQAAVLTLLLVWLRYRWWKRYEWHYDGKWLGLKTGIIGYRQQWIPAEKAQITTLYRGPFQRILGLASVRISGASGHIEIACLPMRTAVRLKNKITTQTAQCNKRWM